MNTPSNTPHKTVRRLVFTPSAKELCMLCGRRILIADQRLRLYRPRGKTTACENFEDFLGCEISEERATGIICKLCNNKILTLKKKRQNLLSMYVSTNERLEKAYEVTSVKRGICVTPATPRPSAGSDRAALPEAEITKPHSSSAMT